jgi:hypothetical protein
MAEIFALIVVLAVMCVTLYGSALVLVEHFWIGLILLIFLSPIFFIWAFIRGIIGKN